jgi:hypothetical protein
MMDLLLLGVDGACGTGGPRARDTMRAVEEARDDLEPRGGQGEGALNVGPADAYSTEPTS